MNKASIDIDILKQFVDENTLLKIATIQAERKADKFKYILNISKPNKNLTKAYYQLKGTIGYSGKVKLWVSHSLGAVDNATTVDKSAICLKYSSLMKAKAKDAILKELLK